MSDGRKMPSGSSRGRGDGEPVENGMPSLGQSGTDFARDQAIALDTRFDGSSGRGPVSVGLHGGGPFR